MKLYVVKKAVRSIEMQHLLIAVLFLSVPFIFGKPVDLQMGARPFGMGGAFTAISDDATSAYWNPAGLTQLSDITLSETQWLLTEVENVNVNYFNAVMPLGDIGVVGGGWLLQHALLEFGHNETAKETPWNESAFSIVAGMRLWEQLGFMGPTSVGISLNRHIILAGSDNGAGVGFDLGLHSHLPYGFRLGLVAKSVATDMMGDRISPEYRVGLGYVWHNEMHQVITAFDLLFKEGVEYKSKYEPVDGIFGTNQKAFVGLEYRFNHEGVVAAVRTGMYQWLNSFRDDRTFTAGIGLGFSGVRADYALQFFEDDHSTLGQSHRITLELALNPIFGIDSKKQKPAETPKKTDRPSPQTAPEVKAPASQPSSVSQPPAPKSFDPNALIDAVEQKDKNAE